LASSFANASKSVEKPTSVPKTSNTAQVADTLTYFKKMRDDAMSGYSTSTESGLTTSVFKQAKAYESAPDLLKPVYRNAYESAYSTWQSNVSDPNSPMYHPYAKPTNYKAIDGLAEYGYDVTKMSDEEIQALVKNARTTDTGLNPAAPTKTSTPEENAAYWAYQYLKEQDTTAAAEAEIEQMKGDVDYYVNTLGLSDEEVIERVMEGDYPTLNKMQEARTTGTTVPLNRAVDYVGEDTVRGMIYTARGGADLGNNSLNAGAYSAGYGTHYAADERAEASRKKSSESYNPYYSGNTTMEDLGAKYRVGKFDREWLEANRGLLDGTDAQVKEYKRIEKGVEVSEKAQTERDELYAWIDEQIAKGVEPEKIYDSLYDDDGTLRDGYNEQGKNVELYPTLNEMEEKRTGYGALDMGFGVDYTREGVREYIFANVPEKEPTPEEAKAAEEAAVQSFKVTDFEANGGDVDILENEIGLWLNGRETSNEEANLWLKKYGWLFSEETGLATIAQTPMGVPMTAPMVTMATTDPRRRRVSPTSDETILGDTAYGMVKNASTAASEGVISNDEYVSIVIDVSKEMEKAEANDMSLEDWIAEGRSELPDINSYIETRRAEKEARAEEEQKAVAQATYEMFTEMDAAVANGTATPAQQQMYDNIASTSVVDVIAYEPAMAEYRDAQNIELRKYAQEEMVGKITAVYGTSGYNATYDDIVRHSANDVADLALSYYDQEYVRAAAMGVDMDTYYEMFPERKLTTEEAYERARTEYANTWSPVWNEVEELYAFVDRGGVGPVRGDITSTVAEIQAGSQAFTPATEYLGEGVGAWETTKASVKHGALAWAQGKLSAIDYFVTSSSDSVVEASNREIFKNDPVAYRKYLEENVGMINDPEEVAAWQYMLENYEGDIFNLTFDIGDEMVENHIRTIQQYSGEIEDFMLKNGTAAENTAFKFGSSAVNNIIMMAESAVGGKLTGSSVIGTTMAFGLPSGAEMGRRLEAAGLDPTAARGAALGSAVITGWIESASLGRYMPKWFGTGEKSILRRGVSWLTGKNPGALPKVADWLLFMPMSESWEEGKEYIAQTAYESVWMGITNGDVASAKTAWRELWDTGELGQNMAMGYLMSPLLGAAGMGFQSATTGAVKGKEFLSTKLARNILQGGNPTLEETSEFIEACTEDMQDPEYIAAVEAIADEDAVAEYVATEVMNGALSDDAVTEQEETEVPGKPKGRRAQRNEQHLLRGLEMLEKKQADAETDLAKLEAERDSYIELLNETATAFEADPSNPQTYKDMMDLTAEVGSLKERVRAAQAAVEKAQAETAEYRAKLDENLLARLNYLRAEGKKKREVEKREVMQEAVVSPNESPEAEAPATEESAEDDENKRITIDVVAKRAAASLEAEFNEYIAGRKMTKDGTWARSKKALSPRLEMLNKAGLLNPRGKAVLFAYVNGDSKYLSTHEADAMRLEVVLDGLTTFPNALSMADVEGITQAQQAPSEVQATVADNATVAEQDSESEADAPRSVEEILHEYEVGAPDGIEPSLTAEEAAMIFGLRETENGTVIPAHINGTPMQERSFDSVDRKQKPYVVENPDSMAWFTMAAELLQGDLSASTPGKRFPLGDLTQDTNVAWSGQKRNTSAPIAALLDNGMAWDSVRGIVDAYAKGDMAYIRKHPVAAQKAEIVMDEMLAEGYTDIEGNKLEALEDYRNVMGYEQRTKNSDASAGESEGDVLFYHGESEAAREARANRTGKKKKIKSAVRIARDLATALDVGVAPARKGREASYDRIASIMRIPRLAHADYLRTFHEIGHAVSKKLDMVASKEMVQSNSFGNDAQEAFAEFFSVYMMNRDTAVKLAGDEFVREFEQKLHDKKLNKPVKKAAADLRLYIDADVDQQRASQFISRTETKRKGVEPWRKFETEYLGRHRGAKKVDRRAGVKSYGLSKARLFWNYHRQVTQLLVQDRMVDLNHREIGKPYNAAFADNGIRTYEEMKEVYQLAVELHAISRAKAGKPVFGPLNGTVESLNKKWENAPEKHKQAVRDMANWWWNFMDVYAVQGGLISKSTYDNLKARYPFYIPTFRDVNGWYVDVSNKGAVNGKGNWKIRLAVGSDIDIIDPMETVMEQMQGIVDAATYNIVARKFDELYQQGDMGDMAVLVSEGKPVPKPPEQAEESENKTEEKLNAEQETGDEVWDSILPNTGFDGKHLTLTREDGTVVTYRITDDLLAEALDIPSESTSKLLKLVKTLNRTYSGLQTSHNVLWAGTNVVKDAYSVAIRGESSLTPIDALIRSVIGMGTILRGKSEALHLYENMGGGGAGMGGMITTTKGGRRKIVKQLLSHDGSNLREVIANNVRAMRGENVLATAANVGGSVFNTLTLNKITEASESAKLVEFQHGMKKGKFTDVEAMRDWFLHAQGSTMDYQQRGASKGLATVTACVQFGNVAVQAVGQTVDTIVNAVDPNALESERTEAWRIIRKTAFNAGMLAAIQTVIARMWFNDDDRDRYKVEASDFKSQYLFMPTRWFKGMDGLNPGRWFTRIPVTEDFLFRNLYSLSLDAMGNVADLDDIDVEYLDAASSMLLELGPIDVSWIKDNRSIEGAFADIVGSTIVGPWAQIAMNITHYGGDLVPTYLQDELVWKQYADDTPQFFIDMSKTLYDELGVSISPIALEYVAQQRSGYFGQMVLPLMSRNREGGWDWGTASRNFMNGLRNRWTIEPAYTNDVTDRYYDTEEELGHIFDAKESEDEEIPFISTNVDRNEALGEFDDVYALYATNNGLIKENNREISALYDDETLSPEEIESMAATMRFENVKLMEEVLDAYIGFQDKYGSRNIFGDIADVVKNFLPN
jgi:hypothetical protein